MEGEQKQEGSKPEGKPRPEKQFTYGGVTTAIWRNEKGKSVSVTRAYKDKLTGEFKHAKSLNESDIPKAIEGLRDAYRHLTKKEAK